MGPELELEARLDGIKAFGIKENGVLSIDSKDESMKCQTNCEDYALGMDKSKAHPELSNENEFMEVNDAHFTTAGGNELVEADRQYTTESSSSSSFDDTASETEDATNRVYPEVGSNLSGDTSSTLDINAFGDLLRRKKKLSTHWRTFIRPLMWRCKWAELQVKKLRYLALKYDRKLAENKRNSALEGLDLKSPPFPNGSPTDKLMKRKKRRRVEDTMNPSSYMSNHPLLSYLDNKFCIAGASFFDEDWHNQVNSTEKIKGSDDYEVHGERRWLESGVDDNSFEEVLSQIGLLQTQVRKLKCRLDKVMTENTGQFSYIDDAGLVIPYNSTNSARYPATPINGNRKPVGSSNIAPQHTSLYNMGNVLMPKGEGPSHRELCCITDVIEGMDQSLQGDPLMKAEDEVLIYDERLREGMKNYDLSIIPMEKPQQAVKEEPESTFSKAIITESEPQTDVQQPLKMRSISKLTAPRKKRKRGRRKSGS